MVDRGSGGLGRLSDRSYSECVATGKEPVMTSALSTVMNQNNAGEGFNRKTLELHLINESLHKDRHRRFEWCAEHVALVQTPTEGHASHGRCRECRRHSCPKRNNSSAVVRNDEFGLVRLALEDALRQIAAQVCLPDCCGPGRGREGVSHGKEKIHVFPGAVPNARLVPDTPY